MDRFLKSPTGKFIVSAIWGIGLACLLKVTLDGKEKVIYRSPSVEYMRKNTFKNGDICYAFEPYILPHC